MGTIITWSLDIYWMEIRDFECAVSSPSRAHSPVLASTLPTKVCVDNQGIEAYCLSGLPILARLNDSLIRLNSRVTCTYFAGCVQPNSNEWAVSCGPCYFTRDIKFVKIKWSRDPGFAPTWHCVPNHNIIIIKPRSSGDCKFQGQQPHIVSI